MASADQAGTAGGIVALPARTQLLARSFLFRGLDATLLERVARLCQPRRLGVGETLLWEDEPADALRKENGDAEDVIVTTYQDIKIVRNSLMERGKYFLSNELPETGS